jgi:hypothetical protein
MGGTTVEEHALRPADDWTPEQLLGKRVAFKDGAEHADCWHERVGLRTGVVVKLGQTVAQKADLAAADLPEELLAAEAGVVRLWVRADPCPAFPRGCEMAAEKECLLVVS